MPRPRSRSQTRAPAAEPGEVDLTDPGADTALHPLNPTPRAHAAGVGRERDQFRRQIAKAFFTVTATLAAMGALLAALLPPGLPLQQRLVATGLLATVAAGALACLKLPLRWAHWGMFSVLATALAVIAVMSVALGWGLAAPGFGFYPLAIFLLSAATHWRWGLALALVALACLLGVDLALSGRALEVVWPDKTLRLAVHLVLAGAGLGCGLLVSQVVARYMRAAVDREARFAGLLAIAADAYWEIDQHYRIVTTSHQRDGKRPLTLNEGLGCTPWELPQFSCDPETLDALLADLDARLPFRDRPVQWATLHGQPRHFLLSGEPRFNERRIFLGYWGVARDVTSEVSARHALAATETLYEELFARLPNPLVLHQAGRIIDANPAALGMFGAHSLEALLGRDLTAIYEPGESRERARRRIEELESLPLGAVLPVADFRMVLRQNRRVSVRATGVRVQTERGPATLSIFIDDTERRAAEEAVRRSEALLSHLVATSPDVITLTDLQNGRFAMVNHTFERVTGYSAAEVVGHSAVDMRIWAHTEDRDRFVNLLRDTGLVADHPAEFRAKDGRTVPLLISGARFAMDNREYLVINGRDVTESERSRLEREAILENASIGIAVTRDRRFVLANPSFERMFDWPPGGLVGQLGSVVWPDTAAYEAVSQVAGPVLARGEQAELERHVVRRDGSSFLARLLAKAVDPSHPARDGTVWIVEDVTERRQFEQTLAAARDAAEAASRAKSAFLANTSHELRTPINGMLHLAMLARDPGLPAERRDQYMAQITESARSLAGIISDILDLSKIEAGRLHIDCMPFDLGDLLRSVQRAYAPLAATRQLGLTLELPEASQGTVLGDALRLRQILSNYLSNALKFTATGTVHLAARRTGERVLFEVLDSGPGIAADVQGRLFSPFTQADESTTRRFGGTGLGLSICRELAELMGGQVGVRSAPGQGSVFWAELPLPPGTLPAHPAAEPPPPGPDVGNPLEGRRVLMAEDNPVNMLIAVALLERWGLAVEKAEDGHAAVEAVQAAADRGQPFDAVLMDVQMPVMSGYQATRALRRREVGRHLPIIALTAAALVSEREAAVEAGMDDFLTKPIDADRLRSTLLRWVGRDRA